MNSVRFVSRLQSYQSSDINSQKSYREFIKETFWKECEQLGSWKPYEDTQNENPVCWWLGNCFFKYRDIAFSAFSHYPFATIRLCLGEILIHSLLIILTLGFNIWCGVITYKNALSKSTGLLASISMLLVFVFSGKMSFVNILFGIPHERQLQYHKNAACCMIVSSLVHGIFKGIKGWQGITGLVYGIILFCLFLFSINYIRR